MPSSLVLSTCNSIITANSNNKQWKKLFYNLSPTCYPPYLLWILEYNIFPCSFIIHLGRGITLFLWSSPKHCREGNYYPSSTFQALGKEAERVHVYPILTPVLKSSCHMDYKSIFQLIKGFHLYDKDIIANHDIKWCFLSLIILLSF